MELQQKLNNCDVTPPRSFIDWRGAGLSMRLVQPRAMRQQDGGRVERPAPDGIIERTAAFRIANIRICGLLEQQMKRVEAIACDRDVQSRASSRPFCIELSSARNQYGSQTYVARPHRILKRSLSLPAHRDVRIRVPCEKQLDSPCLTGDYNREAERRLPQSCRAHSDRRLPTTGRPSSRDRR